MLTFMLAATIIGSIESSVTKTLQDPPEVTRLEYEQLRLRVLQNEEVRDKFVGCVAEGVGWNGGDLITTGFNWHVNPEAKEANPLGINSDARLGLKFAQTAADMLLCLEASKRGSEGKEQGRTIEVAKWISRIVRGFIVFNNSLGIATGKTLIGWGQKEN